MRNSSVELTFSYAISGKLHEYCIKRSWTELNGKITEDLKIFKDLNIIENLSYEQAQGFLNELIPIGVSDLFFFDGEKIAQLAEDDGGNILSDSVKKLIGLDVIEKLTYRCATKVYPNSRGLYDFILVHGYTSKEKLEVIANGSSNGIDTQYFDSVLFSEVQKQELKQSLLLQPNDFVYIFVGRLVGDKGINELISAFSQLETPNSKLLLVGPFETELDPLQPETLKVIKTHPNIISVGFQSDVRPYFAVSDCLVFPSYREGFPNVVMQAGAMGLPSIVTNINGCNEIIVEGENGTIIPVKNVPALVEAMQKMCSDKAYYEQLQQKARVMIQSRYEQQVVWEALLEEYRRLLLEIE